MGLAQEQNVLENDVNLTNRDPEEEVRDALNAQALSKNVIILPASFCAPSQSNTFPGYRLSEACLRITPYLD